MIQNMKIAKVLVFLTLALGFSFASCKYDKIEVLPLPTDATFTGDVLPIFNQSCNTTGCHSAGAIPPDLSEANAYLFLTSGDLVDTLAPEMSKLYERMTNSSNPMPPTGVLSKGTTDKILVWIQNGAQNN
jgi:cytochrome c5